MASEVFVPVSAVKRHLADVRKREKSVFAEGSAIYARTEGMNQRVDREHVKGLVQQAFQAVLLEDGLEKLHEAADAYTQATRGEVACKQGCAHCCHIAVSITEGEAALIERRTGRQRVEPAASLVMSYDEQDEGHAKQRERTNRRHIGTPCTFLEKATNSCSIYEHRPLACRTQLNLDVDDLLCKLVKDKTSRVPYVDMTQFQVFLAEMSGVTTRFADIRDWFPAAKPSPGKK